MDNTDNFQRYMEMPHRRPAYGVNSPAVFRHLVFRMDDPASAASESAIRAKSLNMALSARDHFVARINDRLLAMQVCCNAEQKLAFAKADISEDGELRSEAPPARQAGASDDVSYIDINRTLLTELRPQTGIERQQGWRVRLLADVHSEYYSLTFILDLPNDIAESDVTGDAAQALSFEKLLSDRTSSSEDRTQAIIDFFYEEVWQNVEPNICSFMPGTPGQPTDANLGMPGTRITEFRAVALRDLQSPFIHRPGDTDTPHRKIFLPAAEEFKADFSKSRDGLRDWVMNNDAFVRDILKLNQLTRKLDRDGNCVLCEVLDGGAIYGSSLGQVPAPSKSDAPAAKASGIPAPLRFFIVYNALSKYQLGRLIRRHHMLGELRTAALIDHGLIVKAGAEIRALGNEVDELLGQPHVDDSTTISDADLTRIQNRLHKIHSGVTPGGLSYRVARSAYYADTFEKRLKELRTQRLEGFEPYDVFIARNLHQVFNFIHTVGTRYSLLAERISRLAAMHEVEKTNVLTSEVLKIQRIGEAIGFAAFAYYAGHIFGMILKIGHHQWCHFNSTNCDQQAKDWSETLDIIGVCIALIFATVFLKRLYDWWTAKADARDERLRSASRSKP